MRLSAITKKMLNTAAIEPDLDEALYPLQAAAKIDTGDAAGIFFSGPHGDNWPTATVEERLAILREYIEFERLHGG